MVAECVSCPGDQSVSGLQLADVPLITGTGTILCDVLTPFHRSFMPTLMRQPVFHTLHGLSHPGIRISQNLLAERFVRPGMNKDVKVWARSCLSCQRNKVRCQKKSPPGTFPSPDARISNVHLDVVGPLPPSNGFNHLLTCADRFTRWAEAIPLPNMEAHTIIKVTFKFRMINMRAVVEDAVSVPLNASEDYDLCLSQAFNATADLNLTYCLIAGDFNLPGVQWFPLSGPANFEDILEAIDIGMCDQIFGFSPEDQTYLIIHSVEVASHGKCHL
ncbi:unnamed protein product [Schistocephalus solidus]|uniref:Integrase_H2C2 domain-containing protein n=1 Tax=Schistocephalus solidus TaxID=70667 RepID=A0A183T9P3_SCHSO|nr:unnamed protein product [Schistocephalus solidus]